MKILHIAIWESGGAGIAAMRLHLGLLNAGIDSKLMCLYKTSSEKSVVQYNKRRTLSIAERILERLNIPITNESKNDREKQKYVGEYEEFTFPETDYNILDAELLKQADIVNLHWIGRYVNYPTFFKGINKPVVWTLHDKNPTMGGFHLLLDKEKNKSMAGLEKELQEKKYNWISDCKSLHIVAPSVFLTEYSQKSKTLKNFSHYCIPNGVDTHVFEPHDKLSARSFFNFPKDKKLILFLNSKGYHKGADMVFDCLKAQKFKQLHFVALGEEENRVDGVSYIKSIYDERLLGLLYSAVDVFLIPSREDNLPNMMIESLACGTPVFGTPVGGIVDAIENKFNGIILRDVSSEALGEVLLSFDNNEYSFDTTAIRNAAVARYDLSVQAKNYMELYKKIMLSNG